MSQPNAGLATVRPVDWTDVVALIELDQAVLRDGRGQVRGPREVPELGRMQDRLERFLEGDCSGEGGGMWVACVGGRAVGEATLQRLPPSYCRHVASLALQVHPEHQRQGLGRALLQTVIARATELGVRRLELQVRADNTRAIALYRSEGFAIEFTRRGFVRLPDGQLLDDHSMVRLLPQPDLQKAIALVVRRGEILVLQHPRWGWGLPKGTLQDGESPGAGVVREVWEETGLRASIARSLGWWTQSGADGTVQRWHGFVLETESDTAARELWGTGSPERPDERARWDPRVTGTGDDHGLVYRLEWQPYSDELSLSFPFRFHEALQRGRA